MSLLIWWRLLGAMMLNGWHSGQHTEKAPDVQVLAPGEHPWIGQSRIFASPRWSDWSSPHSPPIFHLGPLPFGRNTCYNSISDSRSKRWAFIIPSLFGEWETVFLSYRSLKNSFDFLTNFFCALWGSFLALSKSLYPMSVLPSTKDNFGAFLDVVSPKGHSPFLVSTLWSLWFIKWFKENKNTRNIQLVT